MAVMLSIYPPIPPFLIPTWEAIGDFLKALLKAFPSADLFFIPQEYRLWLLLPVP